jgi:GlpG protein
MTLLVEIDNLRAALALADFLNAQDIHCVIEKDGTKARILLRDAGSMTAAQQELARFVEEPANERYQAASWGTEQATEVRDVSGEKQTTEENIDGFYQQRKTPGAIWAKAGWVTRIVALISVAVFVLTGFGTNAAVLQSLFFFSSIDAMVGVEQWRWVSPVFVHFLIGGLPLHIVFNVMWWWELGGLVERFQSPKRLWLVFFIVSIASNTAQFFAEGNNFGGLSGVVYGLLGYLWFYGRMRPDFPVQLNPSLIGMMVLWLVLCFTGLLGPVANAAHLSGLLMGSFLAIIFAQKDKKDGR